MKKIIWDNNKCHEGNKTDDKVWLGRRVNLDGCYFLTEEVMLQEGASHVKIQGWNIQVQRPWASNKLGELGLFKVKKATVTRVQWVCGDQIYVCVWAGVGEKSW